MKYRSIYHLPPKFNKYEHFKYTISTLIFSVLVTVSILAAILDLVSSLRRSCLLVPVSFISFVVLVNEKSQSPLSQLLVKMFSLGLVKLYVCLYLINDISR